MKLLENCNAEIRAVLNTVATAEANKAAHQAELHKFMHERSSKVSERDRLIASDLADHSERLLKGLAACREKPKRRSRIRNLSDDIDAIDEILPTLRACVAEAENSIRIAKANLGTAIAPQIAQTRVDALATFRDELHAAIFSAVDLVSLDRVQNELLGEKFTVTGTIPAEMFSSERLIDAFLKDLPLRLKLSSDQLREFKAKVAECASAAVSSIETPDHLAADAELASLIS
jgi:hypothetical protein